MVRFKGAGVLPERSELARKMGQLQSDELGVPSDGAYGNDPALGYFLTGLSQGSQKPTDSITEV